MFPNQPPTNAYVNIRDAPRPEAIQCASNVFLAFAYIRI